MFRSAAVTLLPPVRAGNALLSCVGQEGSQLPGTRPLSRLYFQNITNLTTLPLWSRPDLCDQAHPSLPASFHHWPQSVLSPAVKGPAGAMLLTLELDQPASAHATRGFPRQSKQNPKSA